MILKCFLAVGLALSVAGCATTKGDTTAERQQFVDRMAQQTLQDLYQKHPGARPQIQDSAGYAIFSNIDTNLIFVSTKGGYGVAVDPETGERTYMKMAAGGLGLGAGVEDGRWVMIFRNQDQFNRFIDGDWTFSGEAGAAAKSGAQGGSASVAGSLNRDIVTYQLTEAGISIGASMEGARFWEDDDLNDEIDRQPASQDDDGYID